MRETQVRSLGGEGPLEEEMATHSSVLAWEIPRTEEAGGLQPAGSQRVGHIAAHRSEEGEMVSSSGEVFKVALGPDLAGQKEGRRRRGRKCACRGAGAGCKGPVWGRGRI